MAIISQHEMTTSWLGRLVLGMTGQVARGIHAGASTASQEGRLLLSFAHSLDQSI